MKKIEQQLKKQERKRDEELGKIFRDEWGIEDSKTAHFVIQSLKSDVTKLIKAFEDKENSEITKQNSDESSESETVVLYTSR